MSMPLPPNHPPVPAVLVVEDSETVLMATARLLAIEGFSVLTARDGVEALEVLERGAAHVILSDLSMPRMSGQELAREVVARWPAVRMVFMTGYPESALTQELPGPLLLKPFGATEVIGARSDWCDPSGLGWCDQQWLAVILPVTNECSRCCCTFPRELAPGVRPTSDGAAYGRAHRTALRGWLRIPAVGSNSW
jgi:CheY-like chemotaxis protein